MLEIRPGGRCPRPCPARRHTWDTSDLSSADLVTYGGADDPDLGLSVTFGRCKHCGIALLSVGSLKTAFEEQPLWLEIAGAQLPEQTMTGTKVVRRGKPAVRSA